MRPAIRTRHLIAEALTDLKAATIPQLLEAQARRCKHSASRGAVIYTLERLVSECYVHKPVQGVYIWTDACLTWLDMFELVDPEAHSLLLKLKRFGWSTAAALHVDPPDNIKLYNQRHANMLVKLRKLRRMGMVEKSGNEWAYSRRAENRICLSRQETMQKAMETLKADLRHEIFS